MFMAVPPSRVWPGSSGPTTVSQQDCFIRRVVFLLPWPLPRQRPAGCVLQSAMSNTASVLVGDTGARPPPLWLLSSPTHELAPLYSLRQRLSPDCPSVVHSLSSPTLEKLGWGGKCHHLAQPLHRGDPEKWASFSLHASTHPSWPKPRSWCSCPRPGTSNLAAFVSGSHGPK